MKIKQTRGYPLCLWNETDIIKVIRDSWVKELDEKVQKYKEANPDKEIGDWKLSEREYSYEDRVMVEMTATFCEIEEDRTIYKNQVSLEKSNIIDMGKYLRNSQN